MPVANPDPDATDSVPLYTEVLGQGENLVLVHGWGMHGGFFQEFAQELARHYRVTIPDLPGHGHSHAIQAEQPERIAELLARAAPASAHWFGWSLGASLSLLVAKCYPERVLRLGLITGNPKFSQSPDWPHAIGLNVLDQFQSNLLADFRPTLLRFLKLQSQGMESAPESYRMLKQRLDQRPPPDPNALQVGVEILKHADLRHNLETLEKPVLSILGARDTLVPVGLERALLELDSKIECRVIQDAGHLPFITHRRHCVDAIRNFLSQSDPADA